MHPTDGVVSHAAAINCGNWIRLKAAAARVKDHQTFLRPQYLLFLKSAMVFIQLKPS
jgi:hypothetical protein